MKNAAITGWGTAMPPAVLTNDDLSTILDTNDEWIVTRTGMRERRVSHVNGTEMARIASLRALACAGLDPADLDMIVFGSCSYEEQVPNTASAVQALIGAKRAAAMDVNTACTSFLYGMSAAAAMIKTNVVRNALVIGVEHISPFMDWSNRNVAVLFGDGCAAAVLQPAQGEEGLLGEQLGCLADVRHTLRIRGMGTGYANQGVYIGHTSWDFDGTEIFRHAVQGMAQACAKVLAKCGYTPADVDLVVPHQANLRIIQAVAQKAGVPMEKVMLTVERYGNMSAATVPVALTEAVEEGRVKPGSLILMPAFGAGLTYCAHLVRWGGRVRPIATSDADFSPCSKTAIQMVHEICASREATREGSIAAMQATKLTHEGGTPRPAAQTTPA
jgi:3-oxoacyl-[acyl-carrier-protein] synthase III